eukprot:g26078.t2
MFLLADPSQPDPNPPDSQLYSCNRSVTPACDELCGDEHLLMEDFQRYLDEVMSTSPFEGALPGEVPQVDLSQSEAFIILSQRQALYVALRALAWKMRSRARAASVWIDAMASSGAFEMRVPTAKLKRSSCPVVPHTFQSALTEDDFGLSFKSRLHPTQSMDEVQAQIDYMWVQRLEFPETELAEQTTWAILPGITFAQGENEQHIRLDFFDGQRPPPKGTTSGSCLPEAAAGLPLDAAQFLVLRPGPGPSTPWRALPASTACLAATLRLFARLVPKQSVPLVAGDACEELCRRDVGALGAASPEALMELAERNGLASNMVASPVESLEEMLKNRLAACCVWLDSYVGVLEDPSSGEELEEEDNSVGGAEGSLRAAAAAVEGGDGRGHLDQALGYQLCAAIGSEYLSHASPPLEFFSTYHWPLAWTVDHLQLLGLRGESSGSEKASWEVRKPFRGRLYFDCTIQLDL